jgi:hypothetical protein
VKGASTTSISVSHFTAATAYHPGTMSRSGKPCSTGSGSPFIAYASSTFSSSASASGRPRSKRIGRHGPPPRCRSGVGQRRSATAARDHPRAGRGGVDVHAADHLERLHQRPQAVLVVRFGDQVQSVLTLHDRLTLDVHPELPDVRPAQVIQEHRAHVRILSRATLRGVLVADNEQPHARLLVAGNRRDRRERTQAR